MTKERQMELICGHCDCKTCPIGLESKLCTLAQKWYTGYRIKEILEDIEGSVYNARENRSERRKID